MRTRSNNPGWRAGSCVANDDQEPEKKRREMLNNLSEVRKADLSPGVMESSKGSGVVGMGRMSEFESEVDSDR